MNLSSFVSGIRERIAPPIDMIEAQIDGDIVTLVYRGREVYSLQKRLWDALDPEDPSTIPTDILQGIVTGCEGVE